MAYVHDITAAEGITVQELKALAAKLGITIRGCRDEVSEADANRLHATLSLMYGQGRIEESFTKYLAEYREKQALLEAQTVDCDNDSDLYADEPERESDFDFMADLLGSKEESRLFWESCI